MNTKFLVLFIFMPCLATNHIPVKVVLNENLYNLLSYDDYKKLALMATKKQRDYFDKRYKENKIETNKWWITKNKLDATAYGIALFSVAYGFMKICIENHRADLLYKIPLITFGVTSLIKAGQFISNVFIEMRETNKSFKDACKKIISFIDKF